MFELNKFVSVNKLSHELACLLVTEWGKTNPSTIYVIEHSLDKVNMPKELTSIIAEECQWITLSSGLMSLSFILSELLKDTAWKFLTCSLNDDVIKELNKIISSNPQEESSFDWGCKIERINCYFSVFVSLFICKIETPKQLHDDICNSIAHSCIDEFIDPDFVWFKKEEWNRNHRDLFEDNYANTIGAISAHVSESMLFFQEHFKNNIYGGIFPELYNKCNKLPDKLYDIKARKRW